MGKLLHMKKSKTTGEKIAAAIMSVMEQEDKQIEEEMAKEDQNAAGEVYEEYPDVIIRVFLLSGIGFLFT